MTKSVKKVIKKVDLLQKIIQTSKMGQKKVRNHSKIKVTQKRI